jgi:hypothetical protein
MRKFLLAAAGGAIALVGLSANQCGGTDKTEQTQPAPEPAPPQRAPETTPPESPPAPPPQ